MSDDLRRLEKSSIESFVQARADAGVFDGQRVIDYGSGREPYRGIVERGGGVYRPYDRMDHPGSCATTDVGDWPDEAGVILCTQVLQYVPVDELEPLLFDFAMALPVNGALVLTYPTNWPVVEPQDLHRFTAAGMTRLLERAGFVDHVHLERADVVALGNRFVLGYGCIARLSK